MWREKYSYSVSLLKTLLEDGILWGPSLGSGRTKGQGALHLPCYRRIYGKTLATKGGESITDVILTSFAGNCAEKVL